MSNLRISDLKQNPDGTFSAELNTAGLENGVYVLSTDAELRLAAMEQPDVDASRILEIVEKLSPDKDRP